MPLLYTISSLHSDGALVAASVLHMGVPCRSACGTSVGHSVCARACYIKHRESVCGGLTEGCSHQSSSHRSQNNAPSAASDPFPAQNTHNPLSVQWDHGVQTHGTTEKKHMRPGWDLLFCWLYFLLVIFLHCDLLERIQNLHTK